MGGMAEIFRARTATEGFSKRVCIKRVLPNFLEDTEFVTMFRDEARTAAKLQHGNVVQVFDFGEVADEGGNTLYLAMELVDGADLRRIAEAGRKKNLFFSIGEVVQIGIDVCRGLHHAHTLTEDGRPLGIVHRDVSPHNVLVSRNGEVKVADFGIARAAERATHTSTGIVKGKVAYMSPEQAEGRAFDHRLDQWALGVILWELLCGARLFTGENDMVILRRILGHDVPVPSSRRSEIPAALDEIVLRALSAEPEHRFADLRAMEQALQRFLYSGAVDAAAVDVRDLFPRILEANSGAPQAARRTNVISADAVLSPSLLAPAPATLVAPASLSTAPPPDEPGRSDISIVFTNSGKSMFAPLSSSSSASSASSPMTVTAGLPVELRGDAPVSSSPSPASPSSSPSPRAPSAVTEIEAGELAAEVQRLLGPADGTPVTRTVVPVQAAAARPPTPHAPTMGEAPRSRAPAVGAAAAVVVAAALAAVGVAVAPRTTSETNAVTTAAPVTTPVPATTAAPAASVTTPPAVTGATTTTTTAAANEPAPVIAPAPTTRPATTTTTKEPAPALEPSSTAAAASATSTAAATATATGSVYIEIVEGWATVSEGKKVLGETPLQLRLPEGKHTLTLTSGDGSRTKSIVVVVPPGGRVPVSESFTH